LRETVVSIAIVELICGVVAVFFRC